MSQQGTGHFVGALDVPIDLPLASAGSRSIAYLIDITLVVFFELVVALVLVSTGLLAFSENAGVVATVVVLAVFAMEWLYFIVCEQVMGGQTPGKRLVGLRVVSDDGSDVGALGSIIRNVMRPIDLLPGGYGAGTLAIVLSERHQRLGDMVAGTVVVVEQVDTPSARPTRWPDAFSQDDVRLLETWFRRAPSLLPEPRTRIALDLLKWIERDYPGFLPTTAQRDPQARLEAAFAVEKA